MSSSPTFRFATQLDLEQMIRLRILTQTENLPPLSPAQETLYANELRDYFTQVLPTPDFLAAVAEEPGGRLVSVNGLVIYRKPPSLGGARGLTGYVGNVYTVTDRRGQGLASALIRLLIERARELGVEKLHLGATESGKGVYERVGFGPTRYHAMELRLS